MTELSLCINTRDRAEQLAAMLAAVPVDELAALDGEVVIVDNGSTDTTAEVIERFAATAPCPVRHGFEPRPGASRAKNAGLELATGRILAYTDDDCYLEPGFFHEVLAAFSLGRFSYCGGRMLLFDEGDARYGINEDDSFWLIPPYSFVPAGTIEGACMAWLADVVRDLGGFDPAFGPGTPWRGDEIDLVARASMAGHWGAHVGSMVVRHHHGRKPATEELWKVKAGNDYARGAYYAKFILAGKPQYLSGWLRTSWRHRRHFKISRELVGAGQYTVDRARRALRA